MAKGFSLLVKGEGCSFAVGHCTGNSVTEVGRHSLFSLPSPFPALKSRELISYWVSRESFSREQAVFSI